MEQQDLEQYCQYLAYVVHVLIGRLGGEVRIEPYEVWQAARREATWDREGETLVVRLVPSESDSPPATTDSSEAVTVGEER